MTRRRGALAWWLRASAERDARCSNRGTCGVRIPRSSLKNSCKVLYFNEKRGTFASVHTAEAKPWRDAKS